MFVLKSLVWSWRSLGSEMRFLTDAQVPLWPWYPSFLRANAQSIRGESGKAQQERLKTEGNCFDFVGNAAVVLSSFTSFSFFQCVVHSDNQRCTLIAVYSIMMHCILNKAWLLNTPPPTSLRLFKYLQYVTVRSAAAKWHFVRHICFSHMIQHHWTIQTKCYLMHTKMKKMNILFPCSILFLLIIADKTIFTLSFNFHLFIHLLIRLLNTLEIYTLITQITVGDSMPPLWGGGGWKSLVWPYADTRAYVKCTAALVK